jgi:NAD(P)-dependent dehydrogenase (short-subunit alcohol dehydrogenase family)
MNASFHDLVGASVFITGGGNGIGAALTEGFLAQGAKVAFVGRSDASGFVDEMADKHGNRPLFLPCDITDTAALRLAMDRAAAAHGPLRVLVNNAANDARHVADKITPDEWDQLQAINLRAYFFACQKAASQMTEDAAIINFSSISYMFGAPDMIAYTTANAGITGMTRSLAREWGGRGIRVNAIAPGWVFTEKQENLWATPESKAAFLQRQCLPQAMQPADMVGPVLFLASDASAMVTGQVMVVDAGVVGTG